MYLSIIKNLWAGWVFCCQTGHSCVLLWAQHNITLSVSLSQVRLPNGQAAQGDGTAATGRTAAAANRSGLQQVRRESGNRMEGVNQAYSRLSASHGHITDCKLDSVVYAGVCMWVNVDLYCLDRTICTRQFLGAKPPIQFRHRWAERNHSDHLYWLRAASQLPNSLMPSAKLRSANLPVFTSLVWHGRGSNPGLQHPERTL